MPTCLQTIHYFGSVLIASEYLVKFFFFCINQSRKLYKERILKAQHREEQSKELLTALRKSLKEKKEEEEAKEKKNSAEEEKKSKKKKLIKPKRFKGVTWVRSRLKEYHRKLKESQPSNDSANEEKETTEPKENYVELPKPLLVEG